MEWRDVPGYPGYQVSVRVLVRTSTGYELPLRGGRLNLFRNKALTRLTPAEVLALAWPPEAPQQSDPEAPVPAQEAPDPVEPVAQEEAKAPASPTAHASAKAKGREIPEGFVQVPGFPGYHINRAGVCLGISGRPLTLHKKRQAVGGSYFLGDRGLSVRHLLAMTFGPGAAEAAGFPEPQVEDVAMPERQIRQYGNEAKRRCHDCGKPTYNYRCNACWRRLRGTVEAAEESEWNAL